MTKQQIDWIYSRFEILASILAVIGIVFFVIWGVQEFSRANNIRKDQRNRCAAGALIVQNPKESYDVCMKLDLSKVGTANNPSGVVAPGDEWDF